MRPPSAMIFAAGLGTRFKPWTDKHPKALAIINGKSLLQRNVEYLQQHGIKDVVVNVHHFSEQIIHAIDQNNGWGSNITISDERDAVLETGGGLKKAAPLFRDTTDPIVIINVDILTDLDLGAMLQSHRKNTPLATLAVTNRSTSRYFLFDENDTLTGWRNVTSGEEKIRRVSSVVNQKAFSGIHVISPAIFPLIVQEGKFSIVDVYLNLASEHIIRSFDHSGSRFIDVGKPDSVGKAEQLFS
ncbi:nucleotidyltransferase family protein [Pseudoflavitalea sp. G-6-1-2]|uniref:nucleotidyltransferase family protein n=1 Tax=Pseudoflavitalea sp. G-6-1-2 TaxID=2728841 RepID=UPI00146D7D8E|nr:nucleotidyltransferase family protein [Pseudoflavitalea sp. G-6-1-2]NML19696.1 nucleotidyltransferase family protein [Pseudoflavitalea sp. G-6-1-2]